MSRGWPPQKWLIFLGFCEVFSVLACSKCRMFAKSHAHTKQLFFPSLPRRGGRAIKKLTPFRKWRGRGGQSQVKFPNAFQKVSSGLPLFMFRAVALTLGARLRRFGGFASFY